jgi:hypothetical protein
MFDAGYLSLGYSTPFLSLGASYMYSSLAAAKAAVISVGEEIASQGLPLGICPLVFVFTGTGNVSLGAQEIFKLLPHTFVEPSKLPELFVKVSHALLFIWFQSFEDSEMYISHRTKELVKMGFQQSESIKYMVVLLPAKTWLNTKIHQSHSTK